MLKINDLSISFDGIHQVLDHFNLELEVGDFVTIIGSNGAGKSTLLNCIAGMYPQAKGTIKPKRKKYYYHETAPTFGIYRTFNARSD